MPCKKAYRVFCRTTPPLYFSPSPATSNFEEKKELRWFAILHEQVLTSWRNVVMSWMCIVQSKTLHVRSEIWLNHRPFLTSPPPFLSNRKTLLFKSWLWFALDKAKFRNVNLIAVPSSYQPWTGSVEIYIGATKARIQLKSQDWTAATEKCSLARNWENHERSSLIRTGVISIGPIGAISRILAKLEWYDKFWIENFDFNQIEGEIAVLRTFA